MLFIFYKSDSEIRLHLTDVFWSHLGRSGDPCKVMINGHLVAVGAQWTGVDGVGLHKVNWSPPLCLHLSVLPVGFEASVTEITRRRLVISSRNGVWQLFCMKLQDSKRSETQEMLRDTGCCRTGDTCCWHITPSKSGTLHWICLLLRFMYLKRMHECTERDLRDFEIEQTQTCCSHEFVECYSNIVLISYGVV